MDIFATALVWLLTLIVWLVVASGVILALGVCGFGLYRLYQGGTRQSPVWLMLWGMVTASPLLVHGAWTAQAHASLKSRLHTVATLPRTPVGNDHPHTLVVHGYLNDGEVVELLYGTGLRKVYLAQGTHRGLSHVTHYSATGNAGCDAATGGRAETRRSKARDNVHAKNCLAKSNQRLDVTSIEDDALVLRMGHASGIFKAHYGNTLAGQSPLELRLKRDGQDQLVDYREQTTAEAPTMPFCMPITQYCMKKLTGPATKQARRIDIVMDQLRQRG